MAKDTPLTIETLSAAQEREFRINAPRQIQSILNHMREGWPRVALHCGNDDDDFIMVSLLEIDDGEGMWVSQSMDAEKNAHIMQCRDMTAVGLFDQVKIQFHVDEASPVLYDGFPAFYLAMPHVLYRVQRREYYRLTTAIHEQPRCVIPLLEPHEEEQMTATVMDVSIGGMKLSCPTGDVELEQGQVYADCTLTLPDVGKITVTIKVKSLFTLESHGVTAKYAGCEFDKLSTVANTMLQRYVTLQQHLKAAI